jgi:hypothetical protein
MECGETEVVFCFNSSNADDLQTCGGLNCIFKQCRLTHARLTVKDESTAEAITGRSDQRIQGRSLLATI